MLYKSKSTGQEIEIQSMNDGYLGNLWRKLQREKDDNDLIKDKEWYELFDEVEKVYNDRFNR